MKSPKNIKKWPTADETLLKQVEQQIHSIVPDAEVILYGSRAGGDAGPASDWDFLILVDQPLDRDRILELKNCLSCVLSLLKHVIEGGSYLRPIPRFTLSEI